MRVPIGHDPDTVSLYAPARQRAVRSPQVSKEMANQHQRVRLARSLDPDFVPAPPVPLRSRSWLSVSLAAILAFALIALIAIDRFVPIPTALRQPASNRTADLTSLTARLAAGSTRGTETVFSPLLLRGSRGMSAEPALFGVTLQGRPEGPMVLLTGLAAGMTLSTGNDFGSTAWQASATDTVLSDAWIIPYTNFIGMDLLADLQLADRTIARRWPIHGNWAAATLAVGLPPPSGEAQRLAVTPPRQPMPPQRQSASEEIAILIKRGKGFIGNGDPVGARVMLRRAAESKNAEAALMLAATYDPVVLRELKVYGVAADVAMARTWYEKAKEFGSEEAPRFLEILASATR
jgi:hypothetical protein